MHSKVTGAWSYKPHFGKVSKFGAVENRQPLTFAESAGRSVGQDENHEMVHENDPKYPEFGKERKTANWGGAKKLKKPGKRPPK
jgi:hypothetical protein